MRKFTFIAVILLMLSLFAGCAQQSKSQAPDQNKTEAAGNSSKRFQVIQEEGETKNIGGFTVIKDMNTGKEYLVITSLNGSVAAIDIK
jgi:ABC-type Fe3+-hydroxamate transport system substrate-binding protein